MKRILLEACVVVFCCGFAAGARGDDRGEITALYQKLSSSMKAKDAKGIIALVTPDFKEVRVNKQELKGKQAEDALRKRYSSMKSVSVATVKPDSITVTGNKALIWTSYSLSAEIVDTAGTMGTKGQKHIMADNGKTRDHLVKTAKGWRFQQIDMLKQAPTLDGRSMYQMGPRGRR
jgi:ketosteroid isomerase-like protein